MTAPDGGPCTGPRRRRRKYDGENTGDDETGAEGGTDTFGTGASGGGSGGEGDGDRPGSSRRSPRKPRKPSENVGGGAGGGRKPQQPIWHDILDPVVKDALQSKGIRRTTGTIDISVGPSRIKLGTREYTSMAHADGILAEGSFNCEANGTIGFLWERALIFADGAWTVHPTHSLLTSLSLADGRFLHCAPSSLLRPVNMAGRRNEGTNPYVARRMGSVVLVVYFAMDSDDPSSKDVAMVVATANIYIRNTLDNDNSHTASALSFLPSFSCLLDNVLAVGSHETAETLWGEGKPDPREKLEKAGFQMRRVVLTPRPKAAPVVPTQEMAGLAL